MIWDGAATGDYDILEPLTKTTLIVPRSLAATALPSYRRSFVQTLPRDHAATRSLIQVLSVLNDQLPTMARRSPRGVGVARHRASPTARPATGRQRPGTHPLARPATAGASARLHRRQPRRHEAVPEHDRHRTRGVGTHPLFVGRRTGREPRQLHPAPTACPQPRRPALRLRAGGRGRATLGFCEPGVFQPGLSGRYGMPPGRLRRQRGSGVGQSSLALRGCTLRAPRISRPETRIGRHPQSNAAVVQLAPLLNE